MSEREKLERRIRRIQKEDWVKILVHTEGVRHDSVEHVLSVQIGGRVCDLVGDDILTPSAFSRWFLRMFHMKVQICCEQWVEIVNSWMTWAEVFALRHRCGVVDILAVPRVVA